MCEICMLSIWIIDVIKHHFRKVMLLFPEQCQQTGPPCARLLPWSWTILLRLSPFDCSSAQASIPRTISQSPGSFLTVASFVYLHDRLWGRPLAGLWWFVPQWPPPHSPLWPRKKGTWLYELITWITCMHIQAAIHKVLNYVRCICPDHDIKKYESMTMRTMVNKNTNKHKMRPIFVTSPSCLPLREVMLVFIYKCKHILNLLLSLSATCRLFLGCDSILLTEMFPWSIKSESVVITQDG